MFRESIALGSTLAMVETSTGEIIGSSRYARFDPEASEVEIGWTFLVRRCWGGGHNRESKHLMLEHAFKFVDSVFFVAASTNRRSCKAIEKLGATFEWELNWPPQAENQKRSRMYRIHRESWP